MSEKCCWVYNGEEYSYWDTDCGDAFTFEVDGPKENKFRFCPYCGKELEIKELK